MFNCPKHGRNFNAYCSSCKVEKSVTEKLAIRDELAMSATEEDVKAHLVGDSMTRSREQARYAYADAMIAARKGELTESEKVIGYLVISDGDNIWLSAGMRSKDEQQIWLKSKPSMRLAKVVIL